MYLFMIAVGGLTSPVKAPHTAPLYFDRPPDTEPFNNICGDYEDGGPQKESDGKVITADRKTKQLGDASEEKEAESKPEPLFCPQTLLLEPNHKKNNITTVSEGEFRKLEQGEVLHGLLLFCVVAVLKLYSLFSMCVLQISA